MADWQVRVPPPLPANAVADAPCRQLASSSSPPRSRPSPTFGSAMSARCSISGLERRRAYAMPVPTNYSAVQAHLRASRPRASSTAPTAHRRTSKLVPIGRRPLLPAEDKSAGAQPSSLPLPFPSFSNSRECDECAVETLQQRRCAQGAGKARTKDAEQIQVPSSRTGSFSP
jgi:hypothetical protein